MRKKSNSSRSNRFVVVVLLRLRIYEEEVECVLSCFAVKSRTGCDVYLGKKDKIEEIY